MSKRCQSAQKQIATIPTTLLSAFRVERALCGAVETNQIWTRAFVRNQRAEYCSTDPSVLISEDLTASLELTLSQSAAC